MANTLLLSGSSHFSTRLRPAVDSFHIQWRKSNPSLSPTLSDFNLRFTPLLPSYSVKVKCTAQLPLNPKPKPKPKSDFIPKAPNPVWVPILNSVAKSAFTLVVFLGVLLMSDPLSAWAASGGRMGGRVSSSSSRSSSSSGSSSSRSSSSRPSSSSSRPSSSSSRPSLSSSRSSSSRSYSPSSSSSRPSSSSSRSSSSGSSSSRPSSSPSGSSSSGWWSSSGSSSSGSCPSVSHSYYTYSSPLETNKDKKEKAADKLDKAEKEEKNKATDKVDKAEKDKKDKAADKVDKAEKDKKDKAADKVDNAEKDVKEKAADKVDKAAEESGNYFYHVFKLIVICLVILGVLLYVLDRMEKASTVFKLQVGLLGMAKSLQSELDSIAEAADTSTTEGLKYILTETTVALLRHPDFFVSAHASANVKSDSEEGEKWFNQLSIEERGKFDEETLVNVDNKQTQRPTSRTTDGFNNEYIVVTILVGVKGYHRFPTIQGSQGLKDALKRIGSIPSNQIEAVEVLWTPQAENDTLSEKELHEDYPELKPL